MAKAQEVNVLFVDWISMTKKKVRISNDYASKYTMITNVFVENDTELINYRLLVEENIELVMIEVKQIRVMIAKFSVLRWSHLRRVHRRCQHPMELDRRYHGKMFDRHFDYNVDNEE